MPEILTEDYLGEKNKNFDNELKNSPRTFRNQRSSQLAQELRVSLYRTSSIYEVLFEKELSKSYCSNVKIERKSGNFDFNRICDANRISISGFIITEFNSLNDSLFSFYDFNTNWISPVDTWVKKVKRNYFLSEIKIKKSQTDLPNFNLYKTLYGS